MGLEAASTGLQAQWQAKAVVCAAGMLRHGYVRAVLRLRTVAGPCWEVSATDDAAFIAAICANPADDAVRLVYSDWLEEHGETERSEFIKVPAALMQWAKSQPERG